MSDKSTSEDDAKGVVTRLLVAWRAGDSAAQDRLISLVYHELHGLAQGYMRGEREDHTLQPTSLVHEAYLRMVDSGVTIKDRVHFFALAATVMRRVLIDHARSRAREKRAGHRVTLDEGLVSGEESSVDLVALDDALNRLGEQDDRKRRAVELIYFGGLTHEEAGTVLGVSVATVDRDLRMAKAWLSRALNPAS